MDINKVKKALSGKRIAVVGDVMLDRYILGRVDRMSPEAPVPVLVQEKETTRLGGAANVALNISQLGSTPVVCSVIGRDRAGQEIKSLIEDLKNACTYILESDERPTTVKTRLLGNNQQLLRLDSETVAPLSQNETSAFMDLVDDMLAKEQIDVLILQDYNKGLLSIQLIEHVISICNKKNIFVAVDPKFDNFFAYKNVNFFKPNLKEISQALGRNIRPEAHELDEAAKEIMDQLNVQFSMITLSDKGVYVKEKNKDAEIVPVEKAEIIDVCGAGDAVLAVSALMLHEGLGVGLVGHVANKAGKVVCQKIGVAPVTLAELITDV